MSLQGRAAGYWASLTTIKDIPNEKKNREYIEIILDALSLKKYKFLIKPAVLSP